MQYEPLLCGVIIMNLDDFKNLGFKPKLDSSGKEVNYHPEGVTYVLITDNGQLETTDCYVGYLWHAFNYPFGNELVSRECTIDKIEKCKKWKTKAEREWLD